MMKKMLSVENEDEPLVNEDPPLEDEAHEHVHF